jgi:hypothetical protein
VVGANGPRVTQTDSGIFVVNGTPGANAGNMDDILRIINGGNNA